MPFLPIRFSRADSRAYSAIGIAGSTRLGNFVVIAGQVGVSGHLRIGDGAVVGPQSGVKEDVPAGGRVMGTPSQPMTEFGRSFAAFKRLGRKGK